MMMARNKSLTTGLILIGLLFFGIPMTHAKPDSSTIKKIETAHAPKAIGPYSQALLAEGFVFISGQIPVDPMSGKIQESTIQGQTTQVLQNIEHILKAEGLTFEHVVKTEIFMKDLKDFQEVNKIYGEKFSHENKPARQTIEVSRLPMDALIEISCIAYKGKI
jgi:2-iminobutanoate/2-iminopropanoate deaminase